MGRGTLGLYILDRVNCRRWALDWQAGMVWVEKTSRSGSRLCRVFTENY